MSWIGIVLCDPCPVTREEEDRLLQRGLSTVVEPSRIAAREKRGQAGSWGRIGAIGGDGMRRAVLLASILFLLASGCAREPEEKAAPAAMEDQWTVRGKVVNVAEKGVTIDHQDIPGLMSAMTMAFEVRNPEVLRGVEAGDTVEFTLVRDAQGLHVTRMQKINPAELEAEKKPQS
jgi:protein SCO1/2